MPLNPLSYNVVFISEDALKQASVINENVDMKTLTPTIKLIQDKYLLRLLGTGEFVDLQNKIANTVTPNSVLVNGIYPVLDANDSFLLDAYITPLMIWGVMKEAPLAITYKFMNKGVSKQNSENSQPASMDELQTLRTEAANNFDWYSQRLVFYLNANTQLFPQFLQVRTMDDVAPSPRGYTAKIYLGNGREGTGACDPEFLFR
jgi:hypothetical protein